MPSGFEEDQSKFTGALALGEFFASYDHACPFTDATLQPEIDADPLSALLRLTEIGEPRADLVIPACREVRIAFGEGALALGPDYEIIVNLAALSDRSLVSRLRTTLRLPDNPDFIPNQLVLREHRRAFLG
jgi:hypothetical protein